MRVCVCVCVCVFVYCVKVMRKNAGLGRLLSALPGWQPSVHAVLDYGHHSSRSVCTGSNISLSFMPVIREVPKNDHGFRSL